MLANKPLITLCLLMIFGFVRSQPKSVPIEKDQLIEQLTVITDRSYYIAGEKILFSTNYLASSMLHQSWSSVLYVELIQSDGEALTNGKYQLNLNGAEGSLKIPENCLSGNYFLKAYTQWMRNASQYNYAYVPIKVVNPGTSETYRNVDSAKLQTTLIASEYSKSDNISIVSTQQRYETRKKVKLSFAISQKDSLENKLCVAIIKKGSKNLQNFTVKSLPNELSNNQAAYYFPEFTGAWLRGKLIDKATNQPYKGGLVNLSLLSDKSYLTGFNTTNDGEFFLTLPRQTGEKEFFITAKTNELPVHIALEKAFCKRPVNFGPWPFELNEPEKQLCQELSLNAQLSAKFTPKNKTSKANKTNAVFYGKADVQYNTDKYIELPNLEEFIFEIIPYLTVVKRKGAKSIQNAEKTAFSFFPFFLLVDYIPVHNLEDYLAIKMNKIDKIEIINGGYVVGNLKYSGIINIISKNSDFAGIDLNKNSMFFNYQLYAPETNLNDLNLPKHKNRIPDRRNCLYWQPHLIPNIDGETKIEFYTSDVKGEYEVILYKISKSDGSVQVATKNFIVE